MPGAGGDRDLLGMLRTLLDRSHVMAFRDIAREVREQAARAGLDDVSIFLADLRQEVLREMTGSGLDTGAGSAGECAIEGTLAGRAFQLGRLVPHDGAGHGRPEWWVPLLNGTERLGVLHLTSGLEPERLHADAVLLASVVAMLVVSKYSSTDAYPRLVRTTAMNVAAEMQWQLMPSRTYADDRVVISAVMEPAYQVGGDAFDYALAGDTAHLAVYDAMGHDTSAGLAANLAVAACRNHRRRGVPLDLATIEVEKTLMEEFGDERYVTAVLAELDIRTGVLSWVNRGHLPPLVIRGNRWATRLDCPPAHPMGIDFGIAPTLCRDQLEPGDRVVLYTDGVTESRRVDGNGFGLDGFVDFLIRHHSDDLPVPETLRRLSHSIVEHHGGRLEDDATVLVAEWLGDQGPHRARPETLAGVPLPP